VSELQNLLSGKLLKSNVQIFANSKILSTILPTVYFDRTLNLLISALNMAVSHAWWLSWLRLCLFITRKGNAQSEVVLFKWGILLFSDPCHQSRL